MVTASSGRELFSVRNIKAVRTAVHFRGDDAEPVFQLYRTLRDISPYISYELKTATRKALDAAQDGVNRLLDVLREVTADPDISKPVGVQRTSQVLNQILKAYRSELGQVEELLRGGNGTDVNAPGGPLSIFISHSASDAEFAAQLIALLEKGLQLSPKQIRCTSVDGYRLPAGALVGEYIHREVSNSKLLVGLISERSLDSLYVLFELGARWGTGRAFVPVLLPGASLEMLEGAAERFKLLTAR